MLDQIAISLFSKESIFELCRKSMSHVTATKVNSSQLCCRFLLPAVHSLFFHPQSCQTSALTCRQSRKREAANSQAQLWA